MSEHSKIEWTDATWNVVIGCDKVSPGCDHCYAIRTAHRMQANPNAKIAAAYAGTEADLEWTGQVNLVESRLDLPLRWTKPKRIFVNAQSDLFHAAVPDEFIARVWAVMAAARHHTFQILTKRPARMRSLLNNTGFRASVASHAEDLADPTRGGNIPTGPWDGPEWWPLPNVWLGVSVEDQKRADLRIPALLDTPAAVRFLSMEPLLGPVSFRWAKWHPMRNSGHLDGLNGVGWVIVGGESGSGARPMHPDWVRALRDQCTEAGVAFHFKQWGEWVPEFANVHRDNDRAAFIGVTGGVRELIAGRPVDPPYSRGDDTTIRRAGKRLAGRELDGRTWDEFPEVTKP